MINDKFDNRLVVTDKISMQNINKDLDFLLENELDNKVSDIIYRSATKLHLTTEAPTEQFYNYSGPVSKRSDCGTIEFVKLVFLLLSSSLTFVFLN